MSRARQALRADRNRHEVLDGPAVIPMSVPERELAEELPLIAARRFRGNASSGSPAPGGTGLQPEDRVA
jgi:hypothetical protein